MLLWQPSVHFSGKTNEDIKALKDASENLNTQKSTSRRILSGILSKNFENSKLKLKFKLLTFQCVKFLIDRLLWLGLFTFARILVLMSSKNWICCHKFCGRYINDVGDILKLTWLQVEERRDLNLLKYTFKALHAKQWPSSVFIIKLTEGFYMLKFELFRLYICIRLSSPGKRDIAGHCHCPFNNVPDNLKKLDDSNIFSSHIFKFIKNLSL